MQSKIKVLLPQNNIEERKYVVDVLFSEFLGIVYEVEFRQDVDDYVIEYENHKLIIRDCFFSHFRQPLAYLSLNALPKSILFGQNDFIKECTIPIIYGLDELVFSDGHLICGIDVFASSFFMLTRWEEYVNKKRDKHDRFEGCESIADRFNFLHRPVVNEYVEMLWNMLKRIGYTGDRKLRKYELILTHDIDFLQYPKCKYFRTLVGDIAKRWSLGMAKTRIKYLLFEDPFDRYDWLMTQSENIGVKSHFYFMSSFLISPLYDTMYYINESKFKKVISDIVSRGHVMGFHPGYYSYIDPDVWQNEKASLERMINQSVSEGRQHYLKVKIPETLNIWNENNMLIDSSLGYADREGFRCGTGDEFPVYDFLNQKQMRLRERPLIVMEGTLCGARNYSIEQSLIVCRYYIEISKKYNSQLTLLFHNSSFEDIDWSGWEKLYVDMLTN